MNVTFTPAEVKALYWLLETVLADQEHFLDDETDPDAIREARRVKRNAEKLLKRLDRPRRKVQVVSTRDANGDSEIRLVLVPSSQPKRSRKGDAGKLLNRLDICTCGNRRCRCRQRRRAGIDLATLLNCAEADLLGFLDALDVSAQEEHPAAQTVCDLHAALKQIQPDHACSVDDRGGAR